MDPHERLYRRSLRDVLVAQNVVTAEQADELISSAREAHEPLGAVVVEAGYLTAWDLTKLVSANYQMPVIPLHEFKYDSRLVEGLPSSVLHQYRVLPIGRFGRAWSFAIGEPPGRDLVEALRAVCGSSIFFFVADSADIQRMLKDHVKFVDAKKDSAWKSIFDTGEKAVLSENGASA
jgi:hypothetical protein